jgi:N-glycosidase YbiA
VIVIGATIPANRRRGKTPRLDADHYQADVKKEYPMDHPLDGERLTAEIAGRFLCGQAIDLPRFSEIDDVGAKLLGRSKRPLRLDGIRRLSDQAAAHLGRHASELFLSALEEISEVGIGHLSRHRQIVVPPSIADRIDAARRLREEAEVRLRDAETAAKAAAERSQRGPPERKFVDAAVLVVPADGEIRFFRRDREMFGFLSNFCEAPIAIDGEIWRSTEYYYQAQKSFDPEFQNAIRQAGGPGHVKRLASFPSPDRPAGLRKQSWFDGRTELIRADWQEAKFAVMERAVQAKFTQNADLRAALLATGDARIVEDSESDSYWGIGPDGGGENRLGVLLMKLRDDLRSARGGEK